MKLEFITKRNTNGHCNYLLIDTDKKVYSRNSARMIPDGYFTISKKDMDELLKRVQDDGYQSVDYI